MTSTEEMRDEIASTRTRMSDTLDEIGDRLNPQTIKDNVKDSIKEATIGRVSEMARNATESVQRGTNGIANAVRENPIPAAMIAIGLGWLFFNGKSDSADREGRVADAFRANPLALGAVAVAAGLAVGLSAPKTDRELRLMGGESPTLR